MSVRTLWDHEVGILDNHFGRARLLITNTVMNITLCRIIYAQHRMHHDKWVFLFFLISMSFMQSASHPICQLWEEPQSRRTQWISATSTCSLAEHFQTFTHSNIPMVLLHLCLDLWTPQIGESAGEMWCLKRCGLYVLLFFQSLNLYLCFGEPEMCAQTHSCSPTTQWSWCRWH